MCGRFYLTAGAAEIKKKFVLDQVPELVPRYNIAPTQFSPMVVAAEKANVVKGCLAVRFTSASIGSAGKSSGNSDIKVLRGDALHRFAVGDIVPVEGEVWILQEYSQSRFFERWIVVVVDHIDANHGISAV